MDTDLSTGRTAHPRLDRSIVLDPSGIEVVVVDVLGTLIDETRGLRAAVTEAVATGGAVAGLEAVAGRGAWSASRVDDAVGRWQAAVARMQADIVAGRTAYAESEEIDARAVAEVFGASEPVRELARVGRSLPVWDDSVAGLARIASTRPVLALSNASETSLLHLNASTGLVWHQVISAGSVASYKPDPRVYERAVEVAGIPPERILMVAAHAWDLRGAQAVGMRAAYVHRPVGDPPADSDRFHGVYADLDELASVLDGGGTALDSRRRTNAGHAPQIDAVPKHNLLRDPASIGDPNLQTPQC